MRTWIVIALFLASGLEGADLAADNTLIWLQPDFPPYVIINGPAKDKGIDNRTVQFIIGALPEYAHQFQAASYKRILTLLREGIHGVVTPLFITPERQQYLIYSKVASYLPLPNGIVVHRRNAVRLSPYMSVNGAVDIERVIQSNRITIGIASGRSYFGIIDEMIRRYEHSKIFYERPGTSHTGIFRMVSAGRIDAAFGFPVEVNYLSIKMGLDDDLIVLPVRNMVPYSPVYFAAPKNRWGKRVIEKINRILDKDGVIERFNSYYEYWLNADNLKHYQTLKRKHYAAGGRNTSNAEPEN